MKPVAPDGPEVPAVDAPAVNDALWREELSFREEDERYVSRRQFGKFLTLTSLAMFAGNVWLLLRSMMRKDDTELPETVVARIDEVAPGGVKVFNYPGPDDPCLLVRPDAETFVAYDQKCTHLSCAVVYAPRRDVLECPCHHGFFSVRTGQVLAGPPPRPLPRIRLVRRGDHIVAVGKVDGPGDEST
ncbi:MAG: Rieske 2Fe-2S domain-containing protein [Deltaproteobacteria bacterium]|nr:Rieske 2Fe-2S domain-containing protein [Deltaproteobacteria bacterium]